MNSKSYNKKLFVLSKEWARRVEYVEHSGYERLMDYLPEGSFEKINPLKVYLPYRVKKYFANKSKLTNYFGDTILKELNGLSKGLFKPIKIHILYGDMDFYYLHYLKKISPSSEIIVTFHHPPEELEKRIGYNKHKVLPTIDKAIVMGSNQIEYFREYIEKVEFIPHGIDLSFYKPPKVENRKKKLLVIGVSHRDNERNIKIFNRLREIDPEFELDVILPENDRQIYEGIVGVNIIKDYVPDEELLKYYQNYLCVLLSLIDCTASNTLLESLATGCPLVVNDVGAVSDYIPSSAGIPIFDSEDIENTVNYIIKLNNDGDYLDCIKKRQLLLSKKYDWEKIAKETGDLYQLK